MFGFYSLWKVWYKSEKAFGMCSEWHYTTRGLAYGDMTTRPDGLFVMSTSANLPRCVMPFWTHAHAFSLYDLLQNLFSLWSDMVVQFGDGNHLLQIDQNRLETLSIRLKTRCELAHTFHMVVYYLWSWDDGCWWPGAESAPGHLQPSW